MHTSQNETGDCNVYDNREAGHAVSQEVKDRTTGENERWYKVARKSEIAQMSHWYQYCTIKPR